MSSSRDHWNAAYATRGAEGVSWADPAGSESLPLLLPLLAPGDPVLDAGGGASDLGAALVAQGLGPVTVLDLSDTALDLGRARAGAAASRIAWVRGDVTRWTPSRRFALWHDRAVFHFLTTPAERDAYVRALGAGLAQGGLAIIATFALDGPEKCSGLPVERYDAEKLVQTLGPKFHLEASWREEHLTPWGASQAFTWCVFRAARAA
jgi:SAM-dependent methyltransferase